MTNDAAPRGIDALSREFALACTETGEVTWCDDRCRHALAIDVGASLAALAARGTEAKMQALLSQGRLGVTREWEVALVIDGRPTTVSFDAAPGDPGILMVGRIAPESYLRALDQLSDSMTEVMRLNREVVTARKELQRRHDDLLRLHEELGESHQGVLAMHAELGERAAELGRMVQVKSRIVADAGHELRTPLHAILVLVRLLLDGADGPLGAEQAKQVGFIRKSAEELLQLVDDLLDLSQAEFGRSMLRIESFTLEEFAASVRGMLRPLAAGDAPVALVFDDAPPASLETDRTKLAQVVRNLVSNALKFTESGEVRVRLSVHDGVLEAAVSDTGIGIAPEDQQRIFEEFAQLDTARHRVVKGTGLGLALSRRLARRLGGEIEVQSQFGRGSTFTLSVPLQHPEAAKMRTLVENGRKPAVLGPPVLVVEDDHELLIDYARHFAIGGLHLIAARDIEAAREAVRERRPGAIVLDVMLDGEASWSFLAQVKSDPATRDIPVVVVTVTHGEEKARALGADEYWPKPLDPKTLVARLRELTGANAEADAKA